MFMIEVPLQSVREGVCSVNLVSGKTRIDRCCGSVVGEIAQGFDGVMASTMKKYRFMDTADAWLPHAAAA
ncbi:MAG: hypothetical protein ACYCZ6_10205 [Polaromonas sp.]